MITKIKKIENMGVFSGYSSDVPPYNKFERFKKLNIIYGMNGSGKTTLSKLFEKLANEDEEVEKLEESKSDYPDAKYELIDENEELFLLSGQAGLSIKIFNKGYIEKNIKFEKASANFLIGADIIKKSAILTEKESDKEKAIEKAKILKERYEEAKNSIIEKFRIVAMIIKSDIVLPATARYNSNDARRDYSKLKREEMRVADLDKQKKIVRSSMRDKLSYLPSFKNKGERILMNAKIICEKKSGAEALEELEGEEERAIWIENGLKIHDIRHGKEVSGVECKFCLNTLATDRIERLLGHFSVVDKKIKEEIDKLTNEVDAWHIQISEIFPENEGLLYENFIEDYCLIVKNFKKNKGKFLKWLENLKAQLIQKKQNTNVTVDLKIQGYPSNIFANIEAINKIIELHNEQSDNLKHKRELAVDIIKGHHFAKISSAIKKTKKEGKNTAIDIEKIENFISETENEIRQLKAGMHLGYGICDYINLHIKRFLGRPEIKFSLTENEDGYSYLIERDGVPAENLSEGEKTAITLIYFINELQHEIESQGDNDKCIIVIDDPISSLDSNFLYNAFSLLVTPIKENGEKQLSVEQVFILTHNFEFLKLLLRVREFLASDFKHKEKRGYFMIKNKLIGGKRRAYIDSLDKALEDFKSEYHYLFCRLYEFFSMKEAELDIAYPIPNMTRKMLEIFTEFQIINGDNLADKVKALGKKGDGYKISAINRFVNDKSHGSSIDIDPNSVMPQCKKVLGYVFNLIKNENRPHYRAMRCLLRKRTAERKKSEPNEVGIEIKEVATLPSSNKANRS